MSLRDHLVRSRIAGDVATPRHENLRNIGRMLADHDEYWFGLRRDRDWTPEEVLEVMSRRAGLDPDGDRTDGGDTIDPDLVVAQLDRWRDRLALAAQRRERVLLATGHPTGVLSLHVHVAAALRAAGAHVVVVDSRWSWPWEEQSAWTARRPRHVRCVAGVHVLATGGELLHTHRPEPMTALLAELGDDRPDLVVADHGWAGAAAQAGIDTLGLADSNDPALFVAEEEGRPVVTVPLDDNVPPHLYDPLAAHVTAGWSPLPPPG
ncbi:MAG TPA: phosphatase [Mycobacteriales bacterium]|nr:phosphatase [Mycobacteriales bacterium]